MVDFSGQQYHECKQLVDRITVHQKYQYWVDIDGDTGLFLILCTISGGGGWCIISTLSSAVTLQTYAEIESAAMKT